MPQSKERRGGFDGASCAECMAVHGFGGADGEAIRVREEDFTDGGGFGSVVRQRGGAVRVNVADLARLQYPRQKEQLAWHARRRRATAE